MNLLAKLRPSPAAAVDQSVLLETRALNVAYGQSAVVNDVAIRAHAGEVVCVLGRNGAGKTTLLKSIIGVHLPRAGAVHFGGSDVTKRPSYTRARSGMGYVPQGRGIFPQLTVLENLQMGLEPVRGKDDGQLEEAFTLFPVLKEMTRRPAGVLSGGQQQQLAIGRALMGRPRLLILDEPTEGIQPNIVDEIEQVIARLKSRMTILLVEQFLGFALANADRCYVLESGRITLSGSPAELDREHLQAALSV